MLQSFKCIDVVSLPRVHVSSYSAVYYIHISELQFKLFFRFHIINIINGQYENYTSDIRPKNIYYCCFNTNVYTEAVNFSNELLFFPLSDIISI